MLPLPGWPVLTEEAKETPCLQATMETFLGTACHSQSVLADCLLIHSLNQKIHPATVIWVFPARYRMNCPASYLTATPPLAHTSPSSYSRPDQFSASLLRSPSRFSVIPISTPLLYLLPPSKKPPPLPSLDPISLSSYQPMSLFPPKENASEALSTLTASDSLFPWTHFYQASSHHSTRHALVKVTQ